MANKFLTQLRSSKGFETGTGATITFTTLIAIYSLAMVTSLPGLAVSPILADLQTIFPKSSEFELQMLESLPSLVIIPFILLAGKLSQYISARKLVLWGLIIFSISSILYLLPVGIGVMLFNSALLGIGAGMVIPFSTGLVAHYFKDSRRTQQMGIVSAISNFSLVIATAAAGYLAGIEWHLSFLVYSISIVALILASRMAKTKKTKVEIEAQQEIETKPTNEVMALKSYFGGRIKTDWPIELMIFYFVITSIALAIPMNLSLLMAHYKIGSSVLSGTLISLFFLSVTVPGFFINRLIGAAKERNNLIWIGILLLGVICVMFHSIWSVVIGVVLMGMGYGVMQPLIYDRTSEGSNVSKTTFNLSLVMSMNYLAIILYPVILNLIQSIAGNSVMIPMFISIVLGMSYWLYYFRQINRGSQKSL